MIKSLLLIPSIVLSQTMDSEYCNWLNSNINTDGEYELGWADCEQTCIVMARDAGCDIANYGDHSCWCQFGSDQGEDYNGWYHSCFLGEHCDNNGYDCETMECGDDSSSGSWSSSSDSEDGQVNIDGQFYWSSIHLQEFDNGYCNGYETYSQNYPMGECTCNVNQGYCVYPLYSSASIVEVNFYQGYDCSGNGYVEYNQQFHLNTCFDGTLLTGHHYDDFTSPKEDIDGELFYDYVKIEWFSNEYCMGDLVMVANFPMSECICDPFIVNNMVLLYFQNGVV